MFEYLMPLVGMPNDLVSISAFFLGGSFVIVLVNLLWSAVYGSKAPDNPWGAKTLDWQLATPVTSENFKKIPVVTGDFYDPTKKPEDVVRWVDSPWAEEQAKS